MLRLTRLISRTLSFRLSIMVLVALATLLMAALLFMFSFSRNAVKEEALQKGQQTLETMVQNIDNILLSVEQSSGNIYWKMMGSWKKPDKIEIYRRKLIEGNPYIVNCHVITDSTYNEIDTNVPCWTRYNWGNNSLNGEATISFCLPIYRQQQKVGMLVADVSLTLLSKIVLESKPSPNSLCALLAHDGSFIVCPDSSFLNQNIFSMASEAKDPNVIKVARTMLEGATGFANLKLFGKDSYAFYKPFERSSVPGRYTEKMGWSAGIVYPEDDIFSDYNRLLYVVLIISVTGMFLLLLMCQTFIYRQLSPLRQLSKSAQCIAEGYYNEPIPDSRQQDEVGRLQKHFKQMQQSLATRVGEMKQLSDTLKLRGKELQIAYEQAESAEQMKTSFLYNMSNQMMTPARGIYTCVMDISKNYSELSEEKTNQLVDEIHLRGDKITDLLNQLISDSERQKKETTS